MEETEPQKLFKCEKCNASFVKALFRINHIRQLHPDMLPFSCDLCSLRCESDNALNRHIRDKHVKRKNKHVNKKSAEEWKIRVETACLNYALKHGKHSAQLRYAKLEPELKLGWRKITDLIRIHMKKEYKKYNFQKHHLIKGYSCRGRPSKNSRIPQNIRRECGQYALVHGHDEAQWYYTLLYPNYIFTFVSVVKWCATEKTMKLDPPKDPLHQEFEDSFVSSLNTSLQAHPNLSFNAAEVIIKDHVKNFNSDETKVQNINEENAMDEWLHYINLHAVEKKPKIKLEYCACGNSYKTEKELLKHKPKCWVPDFETDRHTRTQRSCRIKTAASECDTIPDSNSDSSSVIEEPSNIFQCSDCDYSTPSMSRYTRHIKSCTKKRMLLDKAKQMCRNKADPAPFTFKGCNRCLYKHITIEGLREHYRIVHNTHYTDEGMEISLLCGKCSDTFLTYAGLREHACGDRLIKVRYEVIKPKTPSCMLGTKIPAVGTNSAIVYLCPRCVAKFDTIQQLKEHYSAKTCPRVDLYA